MVGAGVENIFAITLIKSDDQTKSPKFNPVYLYAFSSRALILAALAGGSTNDLDLAGRPGASCCQGLASKVPAVMRAALGCTLISSGSMLMAAALSSAPSAPTRMRAGKREGGRGRRG